MIVPEILTYSEIYNPLLHPLQPIITLQHNVFIERYFQTDVNTYPFTHVYYLNQNTT